MVGAAFPSISLFLKPRYEVLWKKGQRRKDDARREIATETGIYRSFRCTEAMDTIEGLRVVRIFSKFTIL